MSSTATYLYCIVRAPSAPRTARAPRGIPGAGHVSMIPVARSLWIAAADVPLNVYGPGPLEAALSDMQWIGEVAVAHEAVIEHFARMRGATVVPMKLFTMFSTIDRAVEDVRGRLDDLREVLARIRGCEEWGIRVLRVPPAPGRAVRAAAQSGAAFLAAKKEARDDARRRSHAAAEAAEEAFETLRAVARDSRRRDEIPEGAAAPPLLDAAFLVPSPRLARFKAAAREAASRCSRAGTEMTLSGPWPAYNFVHPPGRRE